MNRVRHLVIPFVALAASWGTPAVAAEPGAAVKQPLTVFAAASLTESFKAIGSAFEKAHPGLTVQFNFAGSSTLVQQIKEGAPADVFASADEANMQKAADAGELSGAAKIFATNRLAIVVPKDNPENIASLSDLAKGGVTLALAAPEVPAGKYAAQVLDKAGVKAVPATQEVDVRAVLNKVALGEADAGIVYVTDVRAAGDKVKRVSIPDQYNVTARYPIAVLKSAGDPTTAKAFVDYVLSPSGQTTLKEFSFLAPP